MDTVNSIDLTIGAPVQLYNHLGAPMGRPLQPGAYIAKPNVGQQPGWFALYPAGQLADPVANVYLIFMLNREVRLVA